MPKLFYRIYDSVEKYIIASSFAFIDVDNANV